MKDSLFIEIGERIRIQRRRMGLTQEKVAEILGISVTYYGEIERGNRKISVERVITLCEKLDMEPNYLLLGEKEKGRKLLSVFRDCPEEKEPALDQIIRCLAQLYR